MQHNDHCILRFKGDNWAINKMAGLGHIEVRHATFYWEQEVLDLSRVNWPAYIDGAVTMLNDDWWWLDLEDMATEVVEACGGSRGTIFAALRDAHRMGRQRIGYGELKRRQTEEEAQWRREHPDDEPLF